VGKVIRSNPVIPLARGIGPPIQMLPSIWRAPFIRLMDDRVHSNPEGDDSRGMPEEFVAFFAAAKSAQEQKAKFGAAARAACIRLAKACYARDNSQAVTVTAALASIYNGSDAKPVRLDELRWLDWVLLRDLITVLIGTGHSGFEDVGIREAFYEVGGLAAVEWLHWHTNGGRARKAVEKLVSFIVQNRHSSSAESLILLFRSIVNGGKIADLSRLNYMGDELTEPFVIVLDGLWGEGRRELYIEDIQKAFADAGCSSLFSPLMSSEKAV
jgi:hypothetical protein